MALAICVIMISVAVERLNHKVWTRKKNKKIIHGKQDPLKEKNRSQQPI